MVDKELIEIWRNMLKPAISLRLLNTNYEGMGEQDKEEFERDFDEILDLALIGLKYKAQLLQERTDKRTETHACDLISRQAAIDAAELAYVRGMFPTPFIREVPPAQPEPRWIPVTERLPDTEEQVLIYAWNVHYVLAKYREIRTCDGVYKMAWVTEDAYNIPREIKHEVICWMPLPECYRGENDG